MSARQIVRRRFPHHAEPDQRQRVCLLDGVTQRVATGTFRDPLMQFQVHRRVHRAIGLRRQGVDSRCQPPEFRTFGRRGHL
jgi:hypothetical protein